MNEIKDFMHNILEPHLPEIRDFLLKNIIEEVIEIALNEVGYKGDLAEKTAEIYKIFENLAKPNVN